MSQRKSNHCKQGAASTWHPQRLKAPGPRAKTLHLRGIGRVTLSPQYLCGVSDLNNDQFQANPLHLAIRGSDVDKIRSLLASGEDPNVENIDGLVPLSRLAVASGSTDVAKILLAAGADPNGNQSYLPPLVTAAAEGRRELVLLLLESGADPNIVDEDEYTALMYALIRKDCDLALQLMAFGAHPRQVNRYGGDARTYAEEAGCGEVVKRIDEMLGQ
jgi:ankyrin repeat protein